jgi:C-terminal processing protease CtpA/Prc
MKETHKFYKRKYKRKKTPIAEIGNITLEDFVKEESIRKDQYSVYFHTVEGIGLRWYISDNGRVLVNALVKSESKIFAAEVCAQICVGDELVSINGRELKDLDDLNIVQLIQALDYLAKVEKRRCIYIHGVYVNGTDKI